MQTKRKKPSKLMLLFVCFIALLLAITLPSVIIIPVGWSIGVAMKASFILRFVYAVLAFITFFSVLLFWISRYSTKEEWNKYFLIKTIERAAEEYPHLRLGQLISNARTHEKISYDIFHMPDEELRQALIAYMEYLKKEENKNKGIK